MGRVSKRHTFGQNGPRSCVCVCVCVWVCVCSGGIDAYPHMYPVSTHIPYYSSLGGCHSREGWER